MSHKGSRHRVGDYAAYQTNLPRSLVREGDTVMVDGDHRGTAVKKSYLTSEWTVAFPGHGDKVIHENRITKV